MKKLSFALVSLALIAGSAAGKSKAEAPSVQSKADSLVIAITRDENTLTPYSYVTGSPGMDVLRLVYDSLFTVNPDNAVIPWMVDAYTIDSESKQYSFSLKAGLFWHDGKSVTPEDVKFTFEHPLSQNRSRWKKIAGMVESITVSSSGVITLILKSGNPNFIREALADMPIIPKHIFEGVRDAGTVENSVGSGLYKLTEYRPGEYYRFEAAPRYFAGEAQAKYINMPIMTDTSSVFQTLLAGEIAGFTGSVAPETVDTFKNTAGISILKSRGYAPTMLYFNCERDILKDAAFRRAINLGINKKAIINTVMQGYAGEASPGFVTDDAPEYAGLLPSYNPETANRILDGLGYTARNAQGIRQKDGKPISFTLLVYSGNAVRIRTAELIAEDLKAVGIQIKVSAMEADTVDAYMWPEFDVANGRNFDMGMWGWSAPVQLDPASVVSLGCSDPVKGNLNIGGYSRVEYDRLCAQYLASSIAEERAELSKQLQRLLAEDTVFVNLYYQDIITAVNTKQYASWKMQKGVGVINKFSFLK
jgi:peptide/nickel transport system substrate-binding protein